MKTKMVISILAILIGAFLFVYGGGDDSPGAQLLGLVISVTGIVYIVRSRRNR